MPKVGEEYILSQERRAFDIITGTAMLAASAPFMAGAALLLKPTIDGSSTFFRQQRDGMHGGQVELIKLRTFLDQREDGLNDMSGPLLPGLAKRAKFIRKIGIDELPQALNVIRGEICMIGLRPQIPAVLVERQKIDSYLFDEWMHWYDINLGLYGAGQEYAHGIGFYNENSKEVKTLMEVDIKDRESATLKGDIKRFLGMPGNIVASTMSGFAVRHGLLSPDMDFDSQVKAIEYATRNLLARHGKN